MKDSMKRQRAAVGAFLVASFGTKNPATLRAAGQEAKGASGDRLLYSIGRKRRSIRVRASVPSGPWARTSQESCLAIHSTAICDSHAVVFSRQEPLLLLLPSFRRRRRKIATQSCRPPSQV